VQDIDTMLPSEPWQYKLLEKQTHGKQAEEARWDDHGTNPVRESGAKRGIVGLQHCHQGDVWRRVAQLLQQVLCVATDSHPADRHLGQVDQNAQ
jgi:hypothetical protein